MVSTSQISLLSISHLVKPKRFRLALKTTLNTSCHRPSQENWARETWKGPIWSRGIILKNDLRNTFLLEIYCLPRRYNVPIKYTDSLRLTTRLVSRLEEMAESFPPKKPKEATGSFLGRSHNFPKCLAVSDCEFEYFDTAIKKARIVSRLRGGQR